MLLYTFDLNLIALPRDNPRRLSHMENKSVRPMRSVRPFTKKYRKLLFLQHFIVIGRGATALKSHVPITLCLVLERESIHSIIPYRNVWRSLLHRPFSTISYLLRKRI